VSAVRRLRVLGDAGDVVRPVSISLIAIGVVACALAVEGWHTSSLLLGLVLIALAGVLVLQVRRAVCQLGEESVSLRTSALAAERHYSAVLRRIVREVESRDTYWAGHSRHVGMLTRRMAENMGRPAEQCELLGLAGELHDIGMLAVPESVLLSRRCIGGADFRSVQNHSHVSYELLKPLRSLAPALPSIRYHHERMNGSGYPGGLKGGDIPLGARIIAVADAYDAMTHDRPHRPAMSPTAAVAELRRCTPSGYDPRCVESLAEVLNLSELDSARPAGAERSSCPVPATG